MIISADSLSTFFSIENQYVIPLIGLNLIIFSFFVWYVSLKQLSNKTFTNIISGLDFLWVLGSLIIVSFDLFELSPNGKLIIGLVAIWIAFLVQTKSI